MLIKYNEKSIIQFFNGMLFMNGLYEWTFMNGLYEWTF
jgi:hypothetical protein